MANTMSPVCQPSGDIYTMHQVHLSLSRPREGPGLVQISLTTDVSRGWQSNSDHRVHSAVHETLRHCYLQLVDTHTPNHLTQDKAWGLQSTARHTLPPPMTRFPVRMSSYRLNGHTLTQICSFHWPIQADGHLGDKVVSHRLLTMPSWHQENTSESGSGPSRDMGGAYRLVHCACDVSSTARASSVEKKTSRRHTGLAWQSPRTARLCQCKRSNNPHLTCGA